MEKPWLGKALSERAKLYRKPRARPNFLVQLIDSDCEFTIDSGCPPGRPSEEMLEQPFAAATRRARRFCAIIAVQGESGLRLAYRAGEPPRTSIQDLRRSAVRSVHAQSLAHLCPHRQRCRECAFRRHHAEAGVAR